MVPTKGSRTYLVLKLPPYPPPPSTLAAATSTHSGLNVARSSVPDDQPSSNGNDAVLPAAIAVAAFVVTTLVVLRLVRASRTRRRAIAARGQLDEPEPPRMWEVCLSPPRGHTGKWSDLMVRAPPTMTGSLHSFDVNTNVRIQPLAMDYTPSQPTIAPTTDEEHSAHSSPRQLTGHGLRGTGSSFSPLTSDEGHDSMRITVLVTMPSPTETILHEGRSVRVPCLVAIGIVFVDQ